jgi:hypothetical protein
MTAMVRLEGRSGVVWLRWLTVAAAALGVVILLLRARGGPTIVDFKFFWLAGRAWSAGINPYLQPQYRALGIALFGDWTPVMTWLYPPHFLAFVLPYSLLPSRAGLLAWNATGLILSGIAAFLLGTLFARRDFGRMMPAAAMIAYLGLMSASGSALGVGQISFLMLFGVALIAWGIGREAPFIGGVGMAIVMLKPQLGIVLCCAIPFFRYGVRMSAWGVLLVVVGSLPGLVIGGVGATIQGFLHNLSDYRGIDYNLPAYMTGLANPIHAATGRDMPAIPMSLAACVVTVAAMAILHLRWRRAGAPDPQDAAAIYLLLSLGSVAAFVMLHVYDLVILCPLAAILPWLGKRAALACALPLLLLGRPENIGRLTGFELGGPQVAAVGGILLLVVALVLLLRPRMIEGGKSIAPDIAAH